MTNNACAICGSVVYPHYCAVPPTPVLPAVSATANITYAPSNDVMGHEPCPCGCRAIVTHGQAEQARLSMWDDVSETTTCGYVDCPHPQHYIGDENGLLPVHRHSSGTCHHRKCYLCEKSIEPSQCVLYMGAYERYGHYDCIRANIVWEHEHPTPQGRSDTR